MSIRTLLAAICLASLSGQAGADNASSLPIHPARTT